MSRFVSELMVTWYCQCPNKNKSCSNILKLWTILSLTCSFLSFLRLSHYPLLVRHSCSLSHLFAYKLLITNVFGLSPIRDNHWYSLDCLFRPCSLIALMCNILFYFHSTVFFHSRLFLCPIIRLPLLIWFSWSYYPKIYNFAGLNWAPLNI